MQIVINVPDDKCQDIIARLKLDRNFRDYAITTLPKGHGRLVDERDLSLMTIHLIDGVFVCDAPTIIDADKEVDNANSD